MFLCHSSPSRGALAPDSVFRAWQEDGLPVLPGSADNSGGNQGRTNSLFPVGPLLCYIAGRSEESAGDPLHCQPCSGMDRQSRRGTIYSRARTVTPQGFIGTKQGGSLVHSLHPHSQRPFSLECVELSCRFSQQGRWAAAEGYTVLWSESSGQLAPGASLCPWAALQRDTASMRARHLKTSPYIWS